MNAAIRMKPIRSRNARLLKNENMPGSRQHQTPRTWITSTRRLRDWFSGSRFWRVARLELSDAGPDQSGVVDERLLQDAHDAHSSLTRQARNCREYRNDLIG